MWIDNFGGQDPKWEWDYSAGSGYFICPQNIDNKIVVEGGIVDPASTTVYHDSSLHEDGDPVHGINETVVFNARANVSSPSGSAGFGMWNADSVIPDLVWFWWGGTINTDIFEGLRAQVFITGVPYFNQLIEGYGFNDWHTYKVVRLPAGAKFYIDDILVASYTGTMPTSLFRIEAWIDNGYINDVYVRVYTTITKNHILYVDYIQCGESLYNIIQGIIL